MASVATPDGLARLANIPKVAAFMAAEESTVSRLLAEGRLESALVTTLGRKGVAATPAVKNSVQALVRSLETRMSAPAPDARDPSARGQGTVTIMFTDVVGSTAIMERLGDRDGRRLLSTCDDIIRRQTEAQGGSVVKNLGDGSMLTFPSCRGALESAIAVQRSLVESNSRSLQPPLLVRVGLSVGEPVHESEDVYGASVIAAARISAMAEGGQVLVSQIAYTLASSSGEFQFRPVGSVELKGLPGKHALFEVVWRKEEARDR